jgi:predicted ribosome quality control (RQC) complex YloA/Tae2 family protein
MSIPPASLRWDALLARRTARELARALAGAPLRGLRLDGDARDLTLLFEDRTLVWALHPRRGWPRVVGPGAPAEGDFKLRGQVTAVEALPDERIVRFALSPAADRPLSLVVELLGNQWNGLLVEGEPAVIRHVLWRRDGARVQRVGEAYQSPRPQARAGLRGDISEQEWLAALEGVPESERAAALVRTFAWTSPLNAAAFLGEPLEAGAPTGLEVGYARWKVMIDLSAPPAPVVLERETGLQPYPFPLPGAPSRPVASLLVAFEACADAESESGAAPATPVLDPSLLAGLEGALKRATGRVARLEAELAELESPARLRAVGDLILARYADIAHGAMRARLTGFDGDVVEVELDPAEPPHANAAAYYQRATKSERAAERLPKLLEQAKATRARAQELCARARAGTAGDTEIHDALGSGQPSPDAPRETRPSLPYKVFRSSGGLEIRVGRGAKHNDELTFKHSSPGDVWLHARHVGGAHVILRWTGPGNPPARDLAEAATLAALHSKARTSGSVPVDWTLRKYVRKPRKSPPGGVAVERIETLFVRPEPGLLTSLGTPDPTDPSPP